MNGLYRIPFSHAKAFFEYKLKKICSKCKSKKNILVHHKDSNQYNNSKANLEILCRKCHLSYHAKKRGCGWGKGEKNCMKDLKIVAKVIATRKRKNNYKISKKTKNKISLSLKNNKKFQKRCKSKEWRDKVSKNTSIGVIAWWKKRKEKTII